MPELRNAGISERLRAMVEDLTAQRVGVDAVHIPSWERYLEVGGEGLTRRVYTAAELQFCAGDPGRLAARFAGKEAVLKVLGTGVNGIGMREVEIVSQESGRPVVALHGRAAGIARTLSLNCFELSLCHEEGYALAVATAAEPGRHQ
jgi:holo-[acyl-carrier protein] synthase